MREGEGEGEGEWWLIGVVMFREKKWGGEEGAWWDEGRCGWVLVFEKRW